MRLADPRDLDALLGQIQFRPRASLQGEVAGRWARGDRPTPGPRPVGNKLVWLGLMLLYFAAFRTGLFPLGGTGTPAHLVLPALAAGLGGAAWYARLMRSATLDVVRADYVRTARAKGLAERSVVLRHVMRNAILPIITLIGLDIPWFLSGVVLIEAVFAWPGMGKLAVDAVRNVDVPLILGTVLFTALVVVVSNIVTDLVYAFVDPRIRYGE